MDCNAAVKTALSSLQGTIQESGARSNAVRYPRIRSIDFLVQLFQNLISNGIKYRSEEAQDLHFRHSLDDGWTFTVGDNGIGIDQKYFEYIFGVFRRLHGSSIPVPASVWRSAVRRPNFSAGESGSNPRRAGRFHFFLPTGSQDENRTNANLFS